MSFAPSSAVGTPQTTRLVEEIQQQYEENVRLEQKFMTISRGQDMLRLCEIPPELVKLDDLIYQPLNMLDYEKILDTEGFAWMTSTWQQMLAEAFPAMASWPWKKQMRVLINFCHWKRNIRQSAKVDSVEIFAGQGNLSREMLRAGWEGVAVDIRYSADHNVLTVRGLRLAINAVCETRKQGLVWFETPCSSLSSSANTVLEGAGRMTFMGDPDRSLACREGNHLMYVTLLLSMLGSLNDNRVVIEQPCSSCLFNIPIFECVMWRLSAVKAKTYGGSFGQSIVKPLQLWSNCTHIWGMQQRYPGHARGSGGCVDRDGDRYTGRHEDLQMSEEYTTAFGRAVAFHMMTPDIPPEAYSRT